MPTPTWLGPIRQTAFVVTDIEAAAREWVDVHGVGPWFLYHADIPGTQYRGQEVPMRARMGLAQSGGQQIELIQPDPDVPSIYKEFLGPAVQGSITSAIGAISTAASRTSSPMEPTSCNAGSPAQERVRVRERQLRPAVPRVRRPAGPDEGVLRSHRRS